MHRLRSLMVAPW